MMRIEMMRFTFRHIPGILSKDGIFLCLYLAHREKNGYNSMVIMPTYAVLQERTSV